MTTTADVLARAGAALGALADELDAPRRATIAREQVAGAEWCLEQFEHGMGVNGRPGWRPYDRPMADYLAVPGSAIYDSDDGDYEEVRWTPLNWTSDAYVYVHGESHDPPPRRDGDPLAAGTWGPGRASYTTEVGYRTAWHVRRIRGGSSSPYATGGLLRPLDVRSFTGDLDEPVWSHLGYTTEEGAYTMWRPRTARHPIDYSGLVVTAAPGDAPWSIGYGIAATRSAQDIIRDILAAQQSRTMAYQHQNHLHFYGLREVDPRGVYREAPVSPSPEHAGLARRLREAGAVGVDLGSGQLEAPGPVRVRLPEPGPSTGPPPRSRLLH